MPPEEVLRVVLGNGLMLAPLAGIADGPVRLIARLFGAGPTMSEMVSAHGVTRNRTILIREQLGLLERERPLTIQLVGSDPGRMAEAALLVAELGADAVNLNMACPARKVVKGGKGCALMRTPELARAVMLAVREAVSIPVTVKIRAGWNSSSINAAEFARIAQECGLDAVILHPRTREQAFGGKADWSLIAQAVAAVTIPVIGNGDIRTPADGRRMFESTGCAGIMVGRAALGRPWLFALLARELAGSGFIGQVAAKPPFDVDRLEAGDGPELLRLIRFHLELACTIKSEEAAARELRKHVLWYSRGLPGAAAFRRHLHTAHDAAALMELAERFFGHTPIQ